ncbi:tetratricopeptide repeat protein 5 [Rhincodon typus]|uniref:tetratricopeptide repeat protein 5 n=1 Tax=Rhincodon typus TaxID=259920 RepID=UPI00202EE615|nr:tetratricopeptide repeat protein 5 [Rhincodon typus]
MAMAEEKEPESDGERRLREVVDDLYLFRDHYFENHSVEEAGRKQQDLVEKLNMTLGEMDALEGSSPNKAQFLMLKGKALNVVSEYRPKAEEALCKAVKLEPGLVEAWNQLGEVYWKKGDIAGAKTCFSGALNHCKNKVSLRNLSMVLRQISAQGEEYARNVFASVEQAKLAVQMDVKDGTSWYILGNAYLSLFFVTGQNPRLCQQAVSAYAQAVSVSHLRHGRKQRQGRSQPPPPTPIHIRFPCNPRSTHRGSLKYTPVLRSSLWQRPTALRGRKSLLISVRNWCPLHSQTVPLRRLPACLTPARETVLRYPGIVPGMLKAKRLNNMMASLQNKELPVYKDRTYTSASGKEVSLTLKPLQGLNPGANTGSVVIGKVVFSLTDEEKVPFTFGLIDTEGTCLAVMVYNIAESWGVLIGDTVAIPEPQLKQHSIDHNGKVRETGISASESPLVLLVNGRKQSLTSQAAAIVAYKPQME